MRVVAPAGACGTPSQTINDSVRHSDMVAAPTRAPVTSSRSAGTAVSPNTTSEAYPASTPMRWPKKTLRGAACVCSAP